MRLETAGQRLKDYLLSTEDGTLIRHAFHALLAATIVLAVIDWREISAANAELPGFDPAQPETMPVLPPALTEGGPQAPPSEITTSIELLKQPIRFELQPGGVLLAQGAIELGAAARFEQEIAARGEYVKTVSLDSPGGAVGDALAMSKLIRERKIGTRVASGALCASSCPIIMAGGVTRSRGRRRHRRASGLQRLEGEAFAGARHVGGAAHDRRRHPPSRRHGHQARPLAACDGDATRPALLSDAGGNQEIRASDDAGEGGNPESKIKPGRHFVPASSISASTNRCAAQKLLRS
ncbi:hypothetical protein AJ87_18165 [Rhizobium yanglingense]|nr:hypothetical protein AJ87_18165 [Rhizobium yanglingense]